MLDLALEVVSVVHHKVISNAGGADGGVSGVGLLESDGERWRCCRAAQR